MKKIYIDRTVNAGCTGVWVKDAQAVSAGATLYVMSAKEDGPEYRRIEKEYDIHFFFEGKNVPGIDSPGGIDFYTIPQVGFSVPWAERRIWRESFPSAILTGSENAL